MATGADVTPNKRGARSREIVLDAAERLMSEDGYEAATTARIVEETGIPASSIYHYFGSKDGVLLAVMKRGAERFFAEIPLLTVRLGSAKRHLEMMAAAMIGALGRHPNFLRLLIVFATQPPAAADGEVHAVVAQVRAEALNRLRSQLALAYGDDPSDPVIDQLARFALAAIDGAFVAVQTDPGVRLDQLLTPWVTSITAVRRTLRVG
jgi:AcrR family transcriptional regulator